jgi:hypothetical protein
MAREKMRQQRIEAGAALAAFVAAEDFHLDLAAARRTAAAILKAAAPLPSASPPLRRRNPSIHCLHDGSSFRHLSAAVGLRLGFIFSFTIDLV